MCYVNSMPKASSRPELKPREFTIRDVRVVEHGGGVVEVVEVTFSGVPTKVRSLYKGGRDVAMTDVRLYEENKLGPDRLGDSGLAPKWNGNLQQPDRD